jgi:para-aminobenzoate synthetase component II
MILLIDNYDSFTYNLVQRFGEIDPALPMEVVRNDQITLAEIEKLDPTHIILSPGPCTPREAGICNDVLRQFAPTRPVFGVCLGHQCIGEVFGGTIVRAPQVMHGKTSWVTHEGAGVLAGLPSPFEATRYHSLVVDRDTLPAVLEVTAESEDGVIMGLRHRELPIEGVQFHPESILTSVGKELLTNFLGAVAAA